MPFVEIDIKEQPCESYGMVSVFERVWRGTGKGCHETYLFSDDEVLTYDAWLQTSGESDTCSTIYPIEP